ncbi:hypothetical protein [Streptomyces sp. CT34]|uniref:hypothetical protein n=1 Tax=Streptomyces sp. CT34 TaxID=1553907 RepID=UPI0012FF11B1|nr:hypothetical protein [Streptomyces sp. CT34]
MANVEQARGKQLRLVAIQESEDMRRACGLRAKLKDCTFILYRPRPTQSQTNHLILHEIAHEWLGHSTTLTTNELEQLIPDHLHQLIQRYGRDAEIQARARYGTVEEQEAELGAYVIEQLVSRSRAPAVGNDVISQLEHTLIHPVAPPPHIRTQHDQDPQP